MAGPTPGDDAELALRRIDGWRTWYVATNVIDLVAILVMTAGLFLLCRAIAGSGATGAAGQIASFATVVGGALWSWW